MPAFRRPLSDREIRALPVRLTAALALDTVQLIAAHHPVSRLSQLIGRSALIVVRGRCIFWPNLPDDLSAQPETLALLAHELTHIWQYANGMTLWRYMWRERGRYRYRLVPGQGFTGYGYEQQAAMVEDWVRGLNGLKSRWGTATGAELQALLPFPH
ncbi:hypothetical protein [Asticcacaulis sp. YBE204]|uniref:hypothetical protein n=1 Tax=Asticcacaulis sp. YBE204 TaxID=1282363 RepID=UPI0003C3F7A9|nr:hypothetical protein [Asticcacaulis sp. YBE204]ESQ80572.1 hypothetical protein AEYBE204_04700 [Asticcacaulis sp. YBE204]